MDYADFRSLVVHFSKVYGPPYILQSAYGDMDALISEVLKTFSAETRCIFKDDITGTLASGTGLYSLRDTTIFSREILEPTEVVVNGAVRPRVAQNDYRAFNNDYTQDTDAEPQRYILIPPHHIRFHPDPDSAYAVRIMGWVVHQDMDSDSDQIEIPPEYQRLAAKKAACELMKPYAGEEGWPRIQVLEQEVEAGIRRVRGYVTDLRTPHRARGLGGVRGISL